MTCATICRYSELGPETNTITKTNSMHIRSLVLSIILWLSFVLFIVAVATRNAFFSKRLDPVVINSTSTSIIPALRPLSYVFFFVLAIYYIEGFIMVCDCCVKCKLGSSTCRYVSNIKSDSSSERFIAGLKQACPQFRMCVQIMKI